MRYPAYLKKNGTIGFVAPSFGCATEPYKSAFESALAAFHEMGYQTMLGPNCYAAEGIGISNTPQKCAAELQQMYENPENNILLSCGGGELMCEILPYIDWEAIKKAPPKWFAGYSDNTNFTFLQTIMADTASLYAPCAGAFGMKPWHRAVQDAFGVLTGTLEETAGNSGTERESAADGQKKMPERKITITDYDLWEKESLKSEENPTAPYHATEKSVLRVYSEDGTVTTQTRVSGRLLGGCMDCLVNLTGTSVDKVAEFQKKYRDDGILWFLESCDLNVMSIRRAMWHMKQAGWFENTKGFLIGRPLQFGQEMMGLDQYEAVMGIVREYHVPVIMDVSIGHLPPSMPVICGSLAEAVVHENKLTLEMRLR